MKYLDPKPYRRLSKANQDQDGLVLVTSNSSRWRHGVIYLRALAFKRNLNTTLCSGKVLKVIPIPVRADTFHESG